MTPERKSLLLLFLAIVMPVAAPGALVWLFPDVPPEQKLIVAGVAVCIVILTWGFTIHAVGEYQKKRWLSEAQDAKARAADGTSTQDAAAATPPKDALAPQPLGFGTIILAGVIVGVLVSHIAGALLPHAPTAFVCIVGIAAAVTVVNRLSERRKRQILQQAGLDAPAPAPQPRNEASV